MNDPKRILVVFGTRPEVIKLALVIEALHRSDRFVPIICNTGQHRDMAVQALAVFNICPEYDLKVMRPNHALSDLTCRLLSGLDTVIAETQPDFCLVQGDTASAFTGALASFYRQVPVGHVEAGLRTYKKYHPFPEEMNRQLISRIAALHFAPTDRAAQNLCQEGIDPETCFITGNTAIDAIRQIAGDCENSAAAYKTRRMLLVTAHRRENFGHPFENICRALQIAAAKRPNLDIVYVLHPNPNVHEQAQKHLQGIANIRLMPPPDYRTFVTLLKRADLILTDSGGLQEEAPVLHIPVLVLREETERTEAVDAGTVKLVGVTTGRIVSEIDRLLDDPRAYREMSEAQNPYGDGQAARKITAILETYFTKRSEESPIAQSTASTQPKPEAPIPQES